MSLRMESSSHSAVEDELVNHPGLKRLEVAKLDYWSWPILRPFDEFSLPPQSSLRQLPIQQHLLLVSLTHHSPILRS